MTDDIAPANVIPPLDSKQVLLFMSQLLIEKFEVKESLIRPEANLVTLGVDSLDLFEIAQLVEEKWAVRIQLGDATAESTLSDVAEVIVRRSRDRSITDEDASTQSI